MPGLDRALQLSLLPLRGFILGSFRTRKCNVAPVWPKDDISPCMPDERHAPDTRFLVAFSDWHLREEHCTVNPFTMAAAKEAAYRASHALQSEGFQETVEEDMSMNCYELYRTPLQATPLAGGQIGFVCSTRRCLGSSVGAVGGGVLHTGEKNLPGRTWMGMG